MKVLRDKNSIDAVRSEMFAGPGTAERLACILMLLTYPEPARPLMPDTADFANVITGGISSHEKGRPIRDVQLHAYRVS